MGTAPTFVAVGSYNHPVPHAPEPSGAGIEFFELGPAGQLEPCGRIADVENPSFLAIDAERNLLYAVSETFEPVNGRLCAYDVADVSAARQIGDQDSGGRIACHVCRWDGSLAVSHYGDGRITFLPARNDGAPEPVADVVQLEGSGPHPERQTGPRAHCCLAHPTSGRLYAADFGSDTVTSIVRDQSGKPTKETAVRLTPGAGPRHLALDNDGASLFTANELGSTTTLLRLTPEGRIQVAMESSTIPDDFVGVNHCAEIIHHPTQPYVYVSNRGHDSIVVNRHDSDRLDRIDWTHTQGRTPRSFAIDPTGQLLVAANQDTNNLSIFFIDETAGTLELAALHPDVGTPTCVRIWATEAAG